MARPLRYKTVAELETAIEDYFRACEGRPLLDEYGNPQVYKGTPIMIGGRPPTVTGLAYHLGFRSRQALLNYQDKAKYHDTIVRAKLRIEAYTEERLFDRDGVQGAKFSLVNNFANWSDRPANVDTGEVVQIVDDIPEQAD